VTTLAADDTSISNPKSTIINRCATLCAMPASIELERRLRWADSDAAGRLHFPRIFELVEEAESELVRHINWPMNRSCGYDFPRVHVDCNFMRVIDLDAPFRLVLSVEKLGRTSIRYAFKVFVDGDQT